MCLPSKEFFKVHWGVTYPLIPIHSGHCFVSSSHYFIHIPTTAVFMERLPISYAGNL
jgi:hypothetical protein